jgi:hypothetical protein
MMAKYKVTINAIITKTIDVEASDRETAEQKASELFTLVDIENGGEYRMTVPMIVKEINRDRSDTWQDYDENDWREGLREFGYPYVLSIKEAA